MKGLICLVALALLLGSETWAPAKHAAPLVGFSYSPLTSLAVNRVPAQDLATLLDATNPDLVRLPIYWESVEPTPDTLDFSSIDDLLAVVDEHDQATRRQTRVVLTIGARNFLYPELHEPAWAAPRQQPQLNDFQTQAAYRAYFDGSLVRYRSSPLLYAWQVENEPLDFVGNTITGDDLIDVAQISWEVDEVHQLDPGRTVVLTSFDGWNSTIDIVQQYAPPLLAAVGAYPSGHPGEMLAAGDALGLDLYVAKPSVPLSFTSPDLRSVWKQQALDFWAGQAQAQGKQVWVTEMQAQPWEKSSDFTPANLVAGAADYRQEPLGVVLLWGVETWLDDPAWMAGAQQAMALMQS